MAPLSFLTGTGVALVTPFHKDGSIDFKSLQTLVNHQIKGKTEYLVVLGTTGESVTLSKDERKPLPVLLWRQPMVKFRLFWV
jgi:4-hydroxy-tetrahydrodipicolinate synthase